MKAYLPILLCITYIAQSQTLPPPVVLPNGWQLTPAGRSLPLGDLPLNIAISRTGKYMAVVNCGQSTQSIQLFDPRQEKELDSLIIPKTWYGLAFSNDERTLYVSAGNDNMIRTYDVASGKLLQGDSIVLGKEWPERISPAGMAIDDAAHKLYVVTKEDNSLVCIDLLNRKVMDSLPLGGEGYMCTLSPDKRELYVSCWGCDKVKVYDTRSRKFVADIAVGDNPNELLLSGNGKYLYVCNANDNSVSVINVAKRSVIETLNAALYANAPSGSTTNGLALDASGHTLYIANADNNCLAVFDVSKPGNSKAKGFIPVGWYPTNVKCFGNKLFVTNGKGYTSMANPNGPKPFASKTARQHRQITGDKPEVQYIGGLFKGKLSIIPIPGDKTLAEYTKAVYKNTPYSKKKEATAEGMTNNPIPMKRGDKSPIKYVFYVIKENRTYDQILGDMPGGNGDTSLVMFGRKITPNLHKLAGDFVLLDNFYVNAEVSADGHNWSMGGYATDYLEKTWPTLYGDRGGDYDSEGGRAIANNKAGFIWDLCKRSGVSYRDYGEFIGDGKPSIPVLEGHFCKTYHEYNTDIRDTTRFFEWKRDFDSLLAIHAVPSFSTVRFGNDHTDGLKLGRPSPYAHVADNDYAVGLFIDYLAQSPIWNETAVFVLEDDAQSGADHVDAHRSPAYVAGGFVKRNFIDHTPYTTTSVLRTMELILGMPPMTQYDAAAVPMWRCFDTVARASDFRVLLPEVDLGEKNVAVNKWQKMSEKFNIAKEDANPDYEFNLVLWHAVKGNIPFPGPSRAAFLREVEKDRDDD